MKSRMILWTVAAAVAALTAECAHAKPAAVRPEAKREKSEKRDKKDRYIVVQVGDTAGGVTFEAINSDDYAERLKQCREDYTKAMKEWTAAQVEARKNKEKFTEKKPVQPFVRKVSQNYDDRAEAEAYAKKLTEKWQAEQEEKRAKEEQKNKKKEQAPEARGE